MKRMMLIGKAFIFSLLFMLPLSVDAGNKDEADERLALIKAVEAGQTGTVKLLLGEGVNINMILDGGEARTLLMLAALSGHAEVAELLLDKGAAVDDVSHVGRSALHLAVRAKKIEAARVLLERGADVNLKSKTSETPLIIAAGGCDTEMVKLLLVNKAGFEDRDHRGATPLLKATEYDCPETVKVLLESGADPDVALNDGKSALYIAQQDEAFEVLNLLRQYSSKE